MRQVILTALGTSSYSPITYAWDRFPHSPEVTDVFPLALANWFPDFELRVLLTKEAKQAPPWARVRKTLGDRAVPLDIPSGNDVDDVWMIFDTVVGALEGAQEAVFDITHAFRSIPLVALLSAAYAKEAYGVRLDALVYGAFEARRPLRTPAQADDVAPVFDLAGFLPLFDWLTATHTFLRTGDSRELAEEMRQAISGSKPIGQLAEALEDLSLGLELSRPAQVRREADRLQRAAGGLQQSPDLRLAPMRRLLGRVSEAYAKLAGEEDLAPKQQLGREFALIKWYVENGHLVQAATLASEWLVTHACWRLKCRADTRGGRNCARDAMCGHLEPTDRTRQYNETMAAAAKAALATLRDADAKAWRTAWQEVSRIRNEIAHCGTGHRKPAEASKLAQDVRQIPRLLAPLLPR